MNDFLDNFVDLHAHSMYSFLDGHPTPEEMALKAAELGRKAMAITDHGSISGHVLLEKAVTGVKLQTLGATKRKIVGKALDILPIYGMEAYGVRDVKERGPEAQKKFHLTILAKNLTGYKNLIQLVTRSWSEGFYYRQSIDSDMLLDHADGLIVLSGCEKGAFMMRLEQGDWEGARKLARNYRSAFGDDFYVEIQHFPHTSRKAEWAYQLAKEEGLKVVLTCDSHYLDPDGWKVQQLLWAIRDGTRVGETKIEHAYLWEADRLYDFCRANAPGVDWEEVFRNTGEVALKVERFALPRAPHVVYPMAGDKRQYIYERVRQFLEGRGLWTPEYEARLERELAVIAEKGYLDYFLVVADMVNWAKSRGIFVGPARGSAAGSLVCWGLRITEIDPVKFGLLFERFIDPTRSDLPDIDVDFEDERRDEVFAYMRAKWGEDKVAFISTFARFAAKQALNDAARAYGIPRSEIELITRHIVFRSSGDQRSEQTIQDAIEEHPEARAVFERHPELENAMRIQGRVRHSGKHAAGLIVTSEPITNYVALIRPGGTGEPLIAVDWRDSQHLNLMKIDCLGLKELSIIRMIAQRVGLTLEDIYNIPLDDEETIRGFNERDFLGIFQYTGLATKGVASRIHFKNIKQIADVNALSRPGPLHAGATENYIRGLQSGVFVPILPQPEVQDYIRNTYGQIIYQEQVMQILRNVGGLDWTDVCDIRVIMGKSKGSEAFDEYWPKWEAGTKERGVSPSDARQIWETIRLYGKHGFNLAHATAYGIVSYWSMYMKRHYPREFYWAQLVRAGDDEEVRRILQEATRKGIQFGEISLSLREPTWYIDGDVIQPGWSQIDGVGERIAAELAAHAPYTSLEDIAARVNRRIVNEGVRKKIAAKLGLSVLDIYGVNDWAKIDELFPERVKIADVNAGLFWSPEVLIVAKVRRINKKNRIEEWRQKGKDTSVLDPNGLHDYVLLIVEDDTDAMMVYIAPENYERWKDDIWRSEGKYVAVAGTKARDIQLLHAAELLVDVVNLEPAA